MYTMAQKSNKNFMILSALGILFVVDAHAWSPLGLMTNFFPYNSFFMPMFCFISGYFFRPEKLSSFGPFILHKAKTLLLPFFIWNILYGILVTILRSAGAITYGAPISFYTIFIQPFLDCNMFQFNFPAWFVPALFLVILIYSLIRKVLFRLWNEILMFIIFALIGTACVHFSRMGYNTNPYFLPLLKAGFLIQFYQLGRLFQTHLEKLYSKLPTLLVLTLPIVINTILIYKTNDQIYFNDIATMAGFLTQFDFLPLLTSITGICFWLKISEMLVPIFGNNRIVNFISNNTWTIMMHHMLFFNLYNLLLAVCVKLSILHIPFDFSTFHSTAWYRFEPVAACRVIYVIFGMCGPLIMKYFYDKVISKLKSKYIKDVDL